MSAQSVPHNSVEVYNEKKDQWECYHQSLPSRLMGFQIIPPADDHLLLILGGMTHVFQKNFWKVHLGKDAQMSKSQKVATNVPLFLSKVVRTENGFLVFGGIQDKFLLMDSNFQEINFKLYKPEITDLLESYFKVNFEDYGLTKCSCVSSLKQDC